MDQMVKPNERPRLVSPMLEHVGGLLRIITDHSVRRLFSKRGIGTSIGEYVKKLEPSLIPGGNSKSGRCFGFYFFMRERARARGGRVRRRADRLGFNMGLDPGTLGS